MDEQQTTPQEAPQNKSTGPVVGIIIIVVVLAFGGIYFWSQRTVPEEGPTPEEILESPDVALDSLQEQNTSDEIVDIETDLDTTNLDGLDAELENIEAELGNF